MIPAKYAIQDSVIEDLLISYPLKMLTMGLIFAVITIMIPAFTEFHV